LAKSRTPFSDPRQRHDRYFKKARAEGFVARSVFKLEEIDRRFKLLRRGDRVLDLGCSPGSWMQYAQGVVGPTGVVVGIDRHALPRPLAGVRAMVGDLYETPDAVLLGDLPAFDVVMSDMAPDTTGFRATDQARSSRLFEEALTRAERLLAPAGSFVGKIFQGPDVEALRKRMQEHFETVKFAKPDSSRAQSFEIFLVGQGFA